jgi:hypothetical protein
MIISNYFTINEDLILMFLTIRNFTILEMKFKSRFKTFTFNVIIEKEHFNYFKIKNLILLNLKIK